MKKGLVVALALLVVTFTALPLFALDVQFSGDYRVRGFYFDSLYATKPADPTIVPPLGNAAQTANFLDQRFRLTSRITAGMTTGVVQLDFLNVNGGFPNTNLGNREFGQNYSNFGMESNNVGVRQAYLVVNFPVARLYAGRPEVTLGHGIVLKDTVDLIGVGTQLPVPNILTEVQVAYGKLNEQDSFTTGHTKDLDLDFYAMTLSMKPNSDNSFGAYVFYGGQRLEGCTTVTVAAAPGCIGADSTFMPQGATAFSPGAIHDLTELMFGVTADGKVAVAGMGALRYAAEFDNFSGTNYDGRGILGYNFYGDVGADVNLPGAGTASVGLAFLRIQGPTPGNNGKVGVNSLRGDFKFANILFSDSTNNYDGVDINSQFAEGNIGCNPNTFAAVSPVGPLPNCSAQNTSLNHNIQAFKVYAGMKPTDKTNLEVAVLPYVFAIKDGGPTGNCGFIGTGGGCGQNVGFEFDLNAAYKLDDNLKLTAGYGFFNPGDAFSGPALVAFGSTQAQQEKNVQKIEVALTFTF